jgi:hypothetical protein
MLNIRVGDVDEKVLDTILLDAFQWLVDTFGDESITLNKPSYSKKHSALKPFTFKHHLTLSWDYKPSRLNWYYYGQFAEYQACSNSIVLHCNKKHTLGFLLDVLFHEYRHTQQSMYLYHYYKVTKKINYEEHPLEIDANQFALEQLPVFWKKYKQEVASK